MSQQLWPVLMSVGHVTIGGMGNLIPVAWALEKWSHPSLAALAGELLHLQRKLAPVVWVLARGPQPCMALGEPHPTLPYYPSSSPGPLLYPHDSQKSWPSVMDRWPQLLPLLTKAGP